MSVSGSSPWPRRMEATRSARRPTSSSATRRSATSRAPAVQICPPLRKVELRAPATAPSRSASARTTLADFPPSSRVKRLRFPAAARWISRPTSVDPVKESLSTRGCAASAAPVEPSPVTTCHTPSGIPEGVWQVVTGDGSTGAALAAHPRVDKLSFTGSTDVGREIQRAAAGNLKRLTLELGGKSANVVLADADLEGAVAGALNSTFRNGGQICTAGARLVADRRVADELVGRLAERVASIRLGH